MPDEKKWEPSDGAPARNKAAVPQPPQDAKVEVVFSTPHFVLKNPGRNA